MRRQVRVVSTDMELLEQCFKYFTYLNSMYIMYVNLTTTLEDRYYYRHGTDEKTEATRLW